MLRFFISSSERRRIRMHPFMRRMMVSAAATAVSALGLSGGFLYVANEIDVFSPDVIERAENLLWGPGFGQQYAAYKLKRAVYTRPDFLILGSSRVTQFRDVMAPKGVRFYNAALAASSLGDARAFLLSLYKHHRPKTVLLGVDPWWFRPGRSGPTPAGPVMDFNYQALLSMAITKGMTLRVLSSLGDAAFNRHADPLGGRKPVGYHATLSGNGFRADGSYQYGDILNAQKTPSATRRMGHGEDFHFYRQEVIASHGRFAYTGAPDDAERDLLDKIIAEARDQDVALILFFPPMAAAVDETIRKTPAQDAYFAAVKKTVAGAAAKNGIAFNDFQDLAVLGIDDQHTLDGIHVDEIASLAMLNAMIKSNSVLAALYDQVAIDKTEKLLENRQNMAGPHRIIP
ncbi:MAG: hypothetical protein HOL66_01635 [Rhodospirillaceae bacterium]|jgi:hypothetical protein|nr:hypothetical protein [Rhodospirillaceae bacterium]MBT5242927.1 hypothetical protein [Rhodospirillaceae bacterium]MBT5563151.1 hypothetical protein [Rhodospirillaceae bacterium]MBT6243466.1 hypothetical protein [Rhodospirillaceae bacterium]MBT7138312.1 hypothetical protein [Rhodospirillaceae bacterium]